MARRQSAALYPFRQPGGSISRIRMLGDGSSDWSTDGVQFASNPLPVTSRSSAMLIMQPPVCRRFWYPTVAHKDLAAGPKPFTLLGQRRVLWADADGAPVAFHDRCPYRGVALPMDSKLIDGALRCGHRVGLGRRWRNAAPGEVCVVRRADRRRRKPRNGSTVTARQPHWISRPSRCEIYRLWRNLRKRCRGRSASPNLGLGFARTEGFRRYPTFWLLAAHVENKLESLAAAHAVDPEIAIECQNLRNAFIVAEPHQ